jgi:hypothetical protein
MPDREAHIIDANMAERDMLRAGADRHWRTHLDKAERRGFAAIGSRVNRCASIKVFAMLRGRSASRCMGTTSSSVIGASLLGGPIETSSGN